MDGTPRLCRVATTAAAAALFLWLPPASCDSLRPQRIMALGDSITYGCGDQCDALNDCMTPPPHHHHLTSRVRQRPRLLLRARATALRPRRQAAWRRAAALPRPHTQPTRCSSGAAAGLARPLAEAVVTGGVATTRGCQAAWASLPAVAAGVAPITPLPRARAPTFSTRTCGRQEDCLEPRAPSTQAHTRTVVFAHNSRQPSIQLPQWPRHAAAKPT